MARKSFKFICALRYFVLIATVIFSVFSYANQKNEIKTPFKLKNGQNITLFLNIDSQYRNLLHPIVNFVVKNKQSRLTIFFVSPSKFDINQSAIRWCKLNGLPKNLFSKKQIKFYSDIDKSRYETINNKGPMILVLKNKGGVAYRTPDIAFSAKLVIEQK